MTNTYKHFLVGLFVSIMLAIIISFIGITKDVKFIVSIVLAGLVFIGTLIFELWQYDNAWAQMNYWKRKWLDIIGDILFGNLGFIIPLAICFYLIW